MRFLQLTPVHWDRLCALRAAWDEGRGGEPALRAALAAAEPFVEDDDVARLRGLESVGVEGPALHHAALAAAPARYAQPLAAWLAGLSPSWVEGALPRLAKAGPDERVRELDLLLAYLSERYRQALLRAFHGGAPPRGADVYDGDPTMLRALGGERTLTERLAASDNVYDPELVEGLADALDAVLPDHAPPGELGEIEGVACESPGLIDSGAESLAEFAPRELERARAAYRKAAGEGWALWIHPSR